MRVFMLGWEFPPFISGGLGTACYGLTKAMSSIGTDVLFVLPRPLSTPFSSRMQTVAPPTPTPQSSQTQQAPQAGQDAPKTELRLDEFEHVSFRTVDAALTGPYQTPEQYIRQRRAERLREQRRVSVSGLKSQIPQSSQESVADQGPAPVPAHAPSPVLGAAPVSGTTSHVAPGLMVNAPPVTTTSHYAGDLLAETHRYAELALDIARGESFDVVHAHDWLTYPAGMAVAAASGKPLVVHVHATEFDRSGQHVNQRIYDIERRGMHAAIKIIAVSFLTKNIIVQHYGIDPDKVEVVYNAVESNGTHAEEEKFKIRKDEKIVLFLGRITMQKGPEYFLSAAKKVLEVMSNVKFVMAGSGDMIRRTIEMASSMGIGNKVLFTGFLRGGDVEKVFKMADLYVMPSVSEPFGIAPLEAMSHDVPVLISKQSGVSEMISHALKVDFWDVNEMANKIVAVLRHPPLARVLRQHGGFEVRRLSWLDAARACVAVYENSIELMHKTK